VAGLAGLGIFLIGIAFAGYFLLPSVLTRISQTPAVTIDPVAVLATDVAQARISTQTQAAFLSGLTATARIPTLTSTPEKIILGGGAELAFVSDRGDGKTLQIWTMPVYMNNQSQIITGEPRQLTFSEGDKTQPSWSPDGQRIMYVAPGGRVNGLDIWIMAEDGSGAIDLTGQPGNEIDPAWSPNSAVIAYTKPNEDGSPLLYVMRSDGSSVQLLSEEYQESQPTWSADRQWLIFVMSAKGHEYLNMRGMQGGSLTPTAFDQDSYFGRLGEVAHPVFSPDGSWIAYTRMDYSRTYVYTVNFKTRGNDIQRLTTGGVDSWATWSADNHWIAFQSSRDGNLEIYVMTSSGQLQTRVTDNPTRDQQPSWKLK
jgi:TolB protein